MKRILLNSDVGEGYEDDLIIPHLDLCNIACGGHVGAADSVERTIDLALEHDVLIGAHPSYPDKENFGRSLIEIEKEALLESVLNQISLVNESCIKRDTNLYHIKMHGALYSEFSKNADLCKYLLSAIYREYAHISIISMAQSKSFTVAQELAQDFLREGFGDRNYAGIATLQSRNKADAVLTGIAAVSSQVKNFQEGYLKDMNGIIHNIKIDTICLHSDTPNAAVLIREVSKQLSKDE